MHSAGQIQLPSIPLQHFLYDCSCRKTLGYCANAKRTNCEACITLSLADLNDRKKQVQRLLILGFFSLVA